MSVIRMFLVGLLVVFCGINSFSQNQETGNWLMYFGSNKISNKLSVHSEAQYRHYTVAPVNVEQLLLRAGLNYHFADNAFVTAGYGHISGYQFKSEQTAPETTEHRVWQQFVLTNKISRIKFEHRYRLEQRWVNDSYRARFRYRLMLFVPINKTKIEKGALFLGVYDEVFINNKTTFFDRNRLYGALGYQLNLSTSFQLGVMHQEVNSFGKWHLQFALVFNPDFRKRRSR